ncbi:MAG: cell envelope biogenesis protein OmpA [Rhodobacterales bacterium]|nr:MAG: cell envelope biogenesis protein OmpA [Rhodobacterales bacterium]
MLIRCVLLIASLVFALPGAVGAVSLTFPANATLMRENSVAADSYRLPVSAWANGQMQTLVAKGHITVQAWKLSATGLTSLQILEPLKRQLRDAEFQIMLECETAACGGFDFRYGIEVIPEPDMHVDLGDFRFLSAKRAGAHGDEFVALLISRSKNAGYVQLTQIGTADLPPPGDTQADGPPPEATGHTLPNDLPFAETLEQQGFFILADLVFETGSSRLGAGPFASLKDLADYLSAHPNRTVALVGHTDSQGSLANNIALSKKRAQAVVKRLIREFGASKRQLSAEGNGYLSPIASNLTKAGRAKNRRVEVIITSTQP